MALQGLPYHTHTHIWRERERGEKKERKKERGRRREGGSERMQGHTHSALEVNTRGWKGLRNFAERLNKSCNESNHRTPWRGTAHLQHRIEINLRQIDF